MSNDQINSSLFLICVAGRVCRILDLLLYSPCNPLTPTPPTMVTYSTSCERAALMDGFYRFLNISLTCLPFRTVSNRFEHCLYTCTWFRNCIHQQRIPVCHALVLYYFVSLVCCCFRNAPLRPFYQEPDMFFIWMLGSNIISTTGIFY